MHEDRRVLIVPILIITLGVGWLLATLGFVPDIAWIWTLGLAAAGLLTFVVGGFDKFTVVTGPFFLAASCLSVLRQTGRLQVNTEVPILVIVFGVLTLAACSRAVPTPRWSVPPAHPGRGTRDE